MKEDDVAGCAQIAVATAREHMRLVQQHMIAMYRDKSWDAVLHDLKKDAERIKASNANAAAAASKKEPIIKV